jgi:hypothetical protein
MSSEKPGYACVDADPSFQSKSAATTYAMIGKQFKHDEEEEEDEHFQIICGISFDTAKDDNKYFYWIFIPTGISGQVNPYKVEALNELFKHNHNIVPDPIRNFADLSFMRTRLDLYISASDDLKNLKMSEVNEDFRNNMMQKYMSYWDEDSEAPEEGSQIFCNLNTFVANGLVHNITHRASMRKLDEAINGSYLIRESSKSAKDGRGEASVFSISFKSCDGSKKNSIRFLNLHKVGVYPLSSPSPKKLKSFHQLNGTKAIRTLKIKDILNQLRTYPLPLAPPYPTIIHMLQDLHEKEFISIGSFLTLS